jgi:urease accessory protein
MLEIKAKLMIPRSAYRLEIKGRLRLPFALRQGGEARVRLESGEAAVLRLPRGEILGGGDLVTASDGRVIEVLALPEKLLHAQFATATELARAAHALGGRHVPVQAGESFLRVAADHALEEPLRKLGATVSEIEAAFEPDIAAHGAEPQEHEPGHDHGHAHGHHHLKR